MLSGLNLKMRLGYKLFFYRSDRLLDAREAKLVADNFHGKGYTKLEYNKTINRINKQIKDEAVKGRYEVKANVTGNMALARNVQVYYRGYGYYTACNYLDNSDGYDITIKWL